MHLLTVRSHWVALLLSRPRDMNPHASKTEPNQMVALLQMTSRLRSKPNQ
jgi:hypothetical protein